MITQFRLASTVLNTRAEAVIYLPDNLPRRRYPVVYFFRGVGSEWTNPHQDSTRQGRTAVTVVEDLLQKGFIPPVALVFPTTANEEAGIYGGGIDFYQKPLERVPGVGTGKWEEFFWDEFVPTVEEDFSLGGSAGNRALGGFSLGGFAAMALGLKHPKRVSSLSAYDGSFLYWNHDHPGGSGHHPGDLRLEKLPHWFGHPPQLDHFRLNNPADLLFYASGEKLKEYRQLPLYLYHSHPSDPDSNAWRVRRFLGLLHELQITNGADRALLHERASHQWYWVDEYLYHALPLMARHFQSEE